MSASISEASMDEGLASLIFHDRNSDNDGSDETLEIHLSSRAEFLVGRKEDAGKHVIYMQLDSPLVSKEHFRIYVIQYEDADSYEQADSVASMFYCEDLESVNGTYVNNVLIGKKGISSKPFLLSNGDVIAVKPDWIFQFRQSAEGHTGHMDDVQLNEISSFEGRYSIADRLLGSGIYGKVYLAADVATKDQLACKIVDLRATSITTSTKSSPVSAMKMNSMRDERARLIREVDLLTKLNHPNIVQLRKAFRSEFSLYIFMELAPGGDLCSFVLAKGGYLTDLHARVIIRQVVIAVHYLHSIGIVHRDIKPENILVMHTGIGHRVVLTDFGCAAYMQPAGRMASLVGTFDYVAPEVHRTDGFNGRPYTKAVDMWSLGIVTLCLLTGDQLASFEETKKLSQSDIAARLDQPALESAGRKQWRNVTDRAKDFLTKLLILEPASRMTADQAMKHNWFIYPSPIGRELRSLYTRSIKEWKPRGVDDSMVEILPQQPQPSQQIQQDKRRGTKRMPDATASRYFNLDKHLREHEYTRESSQRNKQQLIDLLRESGNTFLQNGDISTYTPTKPNRSTGARVRAVAATNLFGRAPVAAAAGGTASREPTQSQLEQPSLSSEESSMLSFTYDDDLNRGREKRRKLCTDFMSAPLSPNGNVEEKEEELPMRPDSLTSSSLHTDELSLLGPSTTDSTTEDKSDLTTHARGETLYSLSPDELGLPGPLVMDTPRSILPAQARSMARQYSLSEDELAMRDEVWKGLPLFTTGRVYAQKIKEKEQEIANLKD